MFSKTASYYNKLYSSKNYQDETQRLKDIIRKNLSSGGNRLLDVACGTGRHIEYLKEHYTKLEDEEIETRQYKHKKSSVKSPSGFLNKIAYWLKNWRQRYE